MLFNGSSPNNAAVFRIDNVSGSNSTFENLAVIGHNKAFEVYAATNVTFKNTSAWVNTPTGQADNCPYVIQNSFWIWMDSIQGQAVDTNHYVVCGFGNTPLTSEAPLVGLFNMNHAIFVGCPFSYTQAVNTAGSGPGDWMFYDVSFETCNQDPIRINNTTGNAGSAAMPILSEIYINHIVSADSVCSGCGVLATDANLSGSIIQGVHIIGSYGSPAGAAIKMNSGTVRDAAVFCTGSLSSCKVVDGNGNPISGAFVQNAGSGLDFIGSGTTNAGRTDLFGGGIPQDAPPIRIAKAGNQQADVALDPGIGLAFGDSTNFGFQSGIFQNSPETLDIQFAALAPPTNVAGTPASGGSLANGTYYYTVRATSSVNCFSAAGAPSAVSAPVTLSGGNGTVNVSWSLPVASPVSPTGYCVMRGTTPVSAANGASNWYFVSGGSATTFSDTGATPGLGQLPFSNAMQATHRFTPRSLGVNTTNPQFGLDVNGSAAVNSLNQVQKAERFPGSDAAAKINACLTAASSSSGLCDARGMTGTISGASHISIPAGTALLWGQGQLTITDNTNNDAVELLGDGASLYGYQESGISTLPNTDNSGFIGCATAGCTTVKKPNQA